jgi:hypothetical protein
MRVKWLRDAVNLTQVQIKNWTLENKDLTSKYTNKIASILKRQYAKYNNQNKRRQKELLEVLFKLSYNYFWGAIQYHKESKNSLLCHVFNAKELEANMFYYLYYSIDIFDKDKGDFLPFSYMVFKNRIRNHREYYKHKADEIITTVNHLRDIGRWDEYAGDTEILDAIQAHNNDLKFLSNELIDIEDSEEIKVTKENLLKIKFTPMERDVLEYFINPQFNWRRNEEYGYMNKLAVILSEKYNRPYDKKTVDNTLMRIKNKVAKIIDKTSREDKIKKYPLIYS